MWRLRYENKPTNNNNTREWKKKLLPCLYTFIFFFPPPLFCSLYWRSTNPPIRGRSHLQRPVQGTSRPRLPPSCRRPQRTRAAAPYHQQPQQCTTQAATARCRQISMNGTCEKEKQQQQIEKNTRKNCEKKRLQYFKGEFKKNHFLESQKKTLLTWTEKSREAQTINF